MDLSIADSPNNSKTIKGFLNNGNDFSNRKYPESVYRVSAIMNEARGITPSKTTDREISKETTPNKSNETKEPVNIVKSLPSSASSESSSSSPSPPVETPIPPSISCCQHSCGSLFAKCAEHGRSQLLQTFTDPESQLSRQTFQNRARIKRIYQQRSNSYHNVFQKPKKNLFLNSSLKNLNDAKEIRFSFDKEDISRLIENDGLIEKKSSIKSSQVLSKAFRTKLPKVSFASYEDTFKPIIVKRHHSLPNSSIDESFKIRHSCQSPDDNIPVNKKSSEAQICKVKSCYRERSNSDSCKIRKETKKFVRFKNSTPGLDHFAGNEDFHRQSPEKQTKSLNENEDEYNANVDSPPVNYLVLESSSEPEDQEESDSDQENFVVDNEELYTNCGLMGNGAICKTQVADYETLANRNGTKTTNYPNYNDDIENLRTINTRLKKEAKDNEQKIDYFETEIFLLRKELRKRDQDILKLQREVHKLRSVLQQTSLFKQEDDLLSSLQESHGMPGQFQQVLTTPNPNKKQGVSGESSDHGKNLDQIEIERFEKDFRSKQLIKDAIMENDFLKNLDTSQVREIVESVYSRDYPKGSYVLREGEAGSHLYVSAEGELEVIKDNKILGRMGPGKAFGELAILYNCRRTASIRVASDAKVWVLDRRVFQQIMMKTGLQRLQENINFLRSVPLLHQLSNEVLAKIADVLEVDFYPAGAHIIRQGASGDTFFIISAGQVKVTQQLPGRQEDEEIRTLGKGDYFGEQALLKEDCRTASVIALSPGVECLTLDRDSFIQLIGDLSELQEKDYKDEERSLSRPSSSVSLSAKEEYDYIRLDDLEVVTTLGLGGFGRVELVQYSHNENLTFALKCMRKQHIVDTQQQEHVYSEKNIMMACNSPFICRLYRTFRDSKYVYMLMEACLGGEVWTILRDRGCFDDYTTKFVTGCVLEAFEYLHARGIIYRDLKPENLLLDDIGYVKIVDFGFSKRLGFSSKTWTFCGTPEYVAPEIILNKGHDRAVDYWSLGVLMHELLTGTPPFTAPDPMRTYNIILKGIDMIDFPKHMTRAAVSLIKKLCRDSPSERLGYQRGGIQDIKKHKWFEGFDWDGLKRRALTAPITPLVRSPTDAGNFDYYAKETDSPPDEFSNWDVDF